MRRPEYRKAATILVVLALAGCGGKPLRDKVQRAVAVQHPGTSRVRCRSVGTFEHHPLFRCRLDLESGVHAMRPQSGCYVYARGRVADVTRRIGHC
jgi:hypothetical protein